MSSHGLLSPLLVEWSPGRVRVFDPATRSWRSGVNIAAAVEASMQQGREAVIAVSQRSAFVRTISVPNVSRDEISRMMSFKLAPLLPLAAEEYVYGFRLGAEPGAAGRLAIVGALRTDSLRRIHDEAEAAQVGVKAVLPLAFGSWLAARERALTDCLVIRVGEDVASFDVVSHRELKYSRSAALPTSPDELSEEIARTFGSAEVDPSPILSLGARRLDVGLEADIVEQRDAIEFLADTKSIEKLLFSFELPEKVQQRRAQAQGLVAKLALAALTVAVLLGAYLFQITQRAAGAQAKSRETDASLQTSAVSQQKEADVRSARLKLEKTLLDQAFQPAQTFGDIVAAMGSHATTQSWLTGLTLERGKPVSLRGQALSGAQAAKYAHDLAGEPRFRGMKLLFVSKSVIGTKPVVTFAISGHAIGNLPIDRVPKQKKKGP